jgi:hypothetical protein
MAFASISKMTVPGPGTDSVFASQGLLMPKLQYRFRVLFDNFGVTGATTELTKQVVDFTRPNVEFPEIAVEVYNSRYYLAGKPAWQALTLNVRDDASGQVARLVGEQIQKQFDFNEQASAAAGINYKFGMRCHILDGGNGLFEPQVLECWEMYGCYIASSNYNQLAYSANEAVTIQMSIRFDNAVQAPTADAPNTRGVGSFVNRARGDSISGIGGLFPF